MRMNKGNILVRVRYSSGIQTFNTALGDTNVVYGEVTNIVYDEDNDAVTVIYTSSMDGGKQTYEVIRLVDVLYWQN